LAETFKGPILKSSRGVELTTQTGTVASAPWPALGGSCSLAGQLQEPRYQAVKADVATKVQTDPLERNGRFSAGIRS